MPIESMPTSVARGNPKLDFLKDPQTELWRRLTTRTNYNIMTL